MYFLQLKTLPNNRLSGLPPPFLVVLPACGSARLAAAGLDLYAVPNTNMRSLAVYRGYPLHDGSLLSLAICPTSP